LFPETSILGSLEVIDGRSSILCEPAKAVDAVVAIGGDDQFAASSEREAFADELEGVGSVGGEDADVVASRGVEKFQDGLAGSGDMVVGPGCTKRAC
jgi:hypothetical protein